jgi:hypothetical protein
MDNNFTIILITLLTLWLLVTNILIIKLVRRYHKLTSGIKKKELRDLLETVNSRLKEQREETKELRSLLDRLAEDGKVHVQKIGFLRFNPFTDTGGNQSFCLTVLDKHDNGIMISSLHSREQTRIYAKEIIKGKAKGQELSREEKQTLEKAQS